MQAVAKSNNRVRHLILFSFILRYAYSMKKETLDSNPSQKIVISEDQLNLIERNLDLSVDERINQLQSAVDLIEEMRSSLKEINEDRLQNLIK